MAKKKAEEAKQEQKASPKKAAAKKGTKEKSPEEQQQDGIQQGTDLIINALKVKASLKQQVYRQTQEQFKLLKEIIKELCDEIGGQLNNADPDVDISCKENGQFEVELKVAGDTLVFNMHTNIFTFNNEHFVHKTNYVRQEALRSYCGMIQIYNFLSDSFKYQRLNDLGYMIGRVFINAENHFFVEGKGQLGFLFTDFENQVIDRNYLKVIVQASIMQAINFDLWAPDYQAVDQLTVMDKMKQTSFIAYKTGKRLGFQFSAEEEPPTE